MPPPLPAAGLRSISIASLNYIDSARTSACATVYAGAMDLTTVRLEIPEGGNVILGQAHFIKSVEDLYEALVNTVPDLKFGIAFNEASGPCLTRVDGNDDALQAMAARNATSIAAGHIFVI